MGNELDLIELILDAHPVVKGVMVLLALASIASWVVMFYKRRVLSAATKASDAFEASFWSGGDLNTLYRDLARAEATPIGMAGIFEAGFREYGRLKQESGLSSDQLVEGSRRAMRVSHLREMDRLEESLAFLATVSNTSPYVGLFGTVFGIMNSFHALGTSATIADVAPGISEALIATAMGLFAAIPAGIAFNRFADKVTRLGVRYDTFMEELSAIFQRSAARRDASGERDSANERGEETPVASGRPSYERERTPARRGGRDRTSSGNFGVD